MSAGAFPTATAAYLGKLGLGFADAVSGVPAAAKAGAPLLLATRTSLPIADGVELRRGRPRAGL